MPRKSKNKFDIVNNEVHIYRDEWSKIALTTYREDYYEELSSKTWSLTNSNNVEKSYLKNKELGLLHRYIMAKWYGEDVLNSMTERGYIVEHMNNEHMDCRISNLEFLKNLIILQKHKHLI